MTQEETAILRTLLQKLLADLDKVDFVEHDQTTTILQWMSRCDRLKARAEAAEKEVERLKRGDFTPDEFQNLCHNRKAATAAEFFDGCADYQTCMFGMSERDLAIKKIDAAIKRAESAEKQIKELESEREERR